MLAALWIWCQRIRLVASVLHPAHLLCCSSSPHAAATARLTAITRTQLKEVQNTLELVQGQRNELRQEVKDLKAALADAKDTLEVGMPTSRRQPTWHCGSGMQL